MTQQDFLKRSSLLAVLAIVLAAGLWMGLGSQWFKFYGWATVALAAVPVLTVLLWKRLPLTGRSRWWSLALGAPILGAALIQIVFWLLFFSQGPTNPMFGVVREMVRPWLDAGTPFAFAVISLFAVWLIYAAARQDKVRP